MERAFVYFQEAIYKWAGFLLYIARTFISDTEDSVPFPPSGSVPISYSLFARIREIRSHNIMHVPLCALSLLGELDSDW